MIIQTAEYRGSFVTLDKCPQAENVPEFAFIGRSNVGKSSLINYLTQINALCKVSNTPGKTQTINYFKINNQFYLVDLPGYGYARISRNMRDKWFDMIKNYLSKRQQMQYVAVLIDARIPPQKIDLEFIDWLGEAAVPFYVVFTKADRPERNQMSQNIQDFKDKLLENWEELPPMFVTSSERLKGRDEVWDFIVTGVKEFFKRKPAAEE
jgi:GTP-binding protein